MGALSGWITRGQLIHEASVSASKLRGNDPLWQWRLRRESDLVASRVFGSADLTVAPDGLQITSRDGSPFEIGLPLAGPVDLGRWPLLRLDLQANRSGTLGLVYQPLETALPCAADGVAAVPTHAVPLTIDLRQLAWRTSDGKPCAPPGVVTYMLRLRMSLPAAAALTVRSASLASVEDAALPVNIGRDAADIQLPGNVAAGTWTPSAEQQLRYRTPIVRLPQGASAESMLWRRDRVRQFWPAALILPFGQPLPATTAAPMPAWLDIGVCSLYLAWLIWLAIRQRPGVVRPWTEIAAIAAGPLWLIAGLRWGPEPSLPGIVAFLAALIYGGQCEWRRRPVDWGWWGQGWQAWLLPLVPIPVALALMLADGHRLIPLDTHHIVAYLGWALLQQWAMLALVMGRLERTGLPRTGMILVTAGLFGLLHTPNGSLMQLCVLAELWWAWCFTRSPRLVPIALAHAASALLVEAGLTGHWLRSLEVSARFFL